MENEIENKHEELGQEIMLNEQVRLEEKRKKNGRKRERKRE